MTSDSPTDSSPRRGKRVRVGRVKRARTSPLAVAAPAVPPPLSARARANITYPYLKPEELVRFFRYTWAATQSLGDVFSQPANASDYVAPYWHSYFMLQYLFGCRLSEPALIMDVDITPARARVKAKAVGKGRKKKVTKAKPAQPATIIIRRLKKSDEEAGFREHVYVADKRVLDAVAAAQAWKRRNQPEAGTVGPGQGRKAGAGVVVDDDAGMWANPFVFAATRRRETENVGAERTSQLRNADGWQAISRFTADRMFRQIATDIKLPAASRRSVVFRHTRAVLMLAMGASPETVQKAMGHVNLRVTQKYAAVAREYVARLDAAAGGLGTLRDELRSMGLGL